MERSTISDMILQNEMVLYGQPKWTFGKNTCNTYEVFVSYFRRHDGNLLPAWPILEIIEKDDALTMLFSISLLIPSRVPAFATERTSGIKPNMRMHFQRWTRFAGGI